MSDSNTKIVPGTDWTRLLTDPDLVGQLGTLLQTYREAPAEKREQALLAAMRDIKSQAAATTVKGESSASVSVPTPTPLPATETPPFEAATYTPSWVDDRRRFPRIKC